MKPAMYRWQQEALDTWKSRPDGEQEITVTAVTGSGKTRLALEIIDDWKQYGGRLGWEFYDYITIIVPKKALLIQWRDELIAWGIPASDIGRCGGGSIKGWKNDAGNHITIATINAMRDGKMSAFLHEIPELNHLVVVDECHNLRGAKNREALSQKNCPRDAVLGLSATPHPTAEARQVVESLCGKIRYSYRYGQALADGVIPPFVLNAVQIPLNGEEQLEIDILDKKIKNVMKEQRDAWGAEANRLLQIAKHIGMQRKRVLNRCRSRFHMTLRILNRHGVDTPTLLFHDSIEDIERLAAMTTHLNPVLYHSKQGKGESGLDAFANKETNHLYSCLALTEGFNVPWVRMAVMMSGPNAPLRRVQTLGRCLRGKTEEPNEIYFLYVAGTKDEEGLHNLLREGDIPSKIKTNGNTISVVRHYKMTWEWMEEIPAPKPPKVFTAHQYLLEDPPETWGEFAKGYHT